MPLATQVYVNVPFVLSVTTSSQVSRTGMFATSLPEGVSLYAPGGPLAGTISTPGVYTFPLTAIFEGGLSHQATMTIRAIHAPTAPLSPVAIPDQSLTLSGATQIPLQNYFSDHDSESVMRMHTNLWDLDLILYASA
ncbi:MAG TPA: putative Ig domain-containing protein, partial [Verrucomicrobium sp.]|nr:putative Ig domain-containing protein [Verrucomicrobium sp.]